MGLPILCGLGDRRGALTILFRMPSTITLDRTSHLLIMFSAEAYNQDPTHRIWVKATVGTESAIPGAIFLTPFLETANGHTHTVTYMTYSCNWHRPSMSAGSYTVKIRWMVTGGIGWAARALCLWAIHSAVSKP